MKRNNYLLIFFLLPFMLYGQGAAVVLDEGRLGNDIAQGAEEKAEEEVQKNILETIEQVAKKSQEITDSINIYMNVVTDYVTSAKQVYEAGEIIYYTIQSYKSITDEIKNSKYITVNDKIRYLNQIMRIVENMQDKFNKIKDLSGQNSQGLSLEQRRSVEGNMKDGERLRLITRHVKGMAVELAQIGSIYKQFNRQERDIRLSAMRNNCTANSMFFNVY